MKGLNTYLSKRISSLTEDELKQCYNELLEYNEKGYMGDTLIRQIRNEFAELIDDDSWDMSCNIVIIPEILFEIAKRHYKSN